MDYVKSGDLGVVIERREWVEKMEIGYRISDIGVGTVSNNKHIYAVASMTKWVLKCLGPGQVEIVNWCKTNISTTQYTPGIVCTDVQV